MAVMRITVTGLHYGVVNCQNVLHFFNGDGLLSDAACAAEMRDGWCTISAAARASQFGFRNIKVERLGTGNAPFNLPISINGQDLSDASNSMPPVCVKWILRTSIGGRKGRGRIYQAGYRAAYWNQGVLTSTAITNITSHINQISARYISPGTGPLYLMVGPRQFVTSDDYKLVTNITLSLTPGIQRRRTVGVGI